MWPYVVRAISAVLSAGNYVGSYVEIDRDMVRCSATVAESAVLRGYVLFEVESTGQWEQRVADWIANYWCCMLEEVRPIRISCTVMPSLRGLTEGETGSGGVLLDPVRLESVMRVVTSAGVSVFPGQDVHVVANFLLIKLRECLSDPILTACPALVRVSVNYYLFTKRCPYVILVFFWGGGLDVESVSNFCFRSLL